MKMLDRLNRLKATTSAVSKTAERVIDKIENIEVPFLYFILTYLFATTLRNFVEPLSTHVEISLIVFAHNYLFYTAVALSLIILFHLATKTPVARVAKVILPSFLILVMAPSLDLLISGGKGFSMAYLLPGVHDDLCWRFLTFFGHFDKLGVTPGIKIEIGLVLLGSFLYFLAKTSRLIKSLWCTFLTYAIIFAFSITPFAVKNIVELLGLEFNTSHELPINFFAAIILLFGVMIAYLGNKTYFISLVRDIRLLRVVYYLSMFALGIAIGTSNTVFELTSTNIFHFLFVPVSLVFAILFSIVTNNIADYEIDKTVNPNRPLIKGSISLDVYRKLIWPFLLVAMFYAALVNFTTLFLITLFIGNYFLYSMPPVRFKRITFLSKIIISLNSLALTTLGFFTITESIHGMPNIIFPIFLIGFTAMANMIDIKDYHGDKQARIKTLPVILGLFRAKLVIGLFFLLAYSALFFTVTFLNAPIYWFFAFAGLGIIQCLLINRKDYNETPVFVVMLATIWLMIYVIIQ